MTKKPPVAFDKIRHGVFTTEPGPLRFSNALRSLREGGNTAGADEFQRDKDTAAHCPIHGPLEDPIIGLVGDRVGFVCPWCSDPEILAAWEREGNRS